MHRIDPRHPWYSADDAARRAMGMLLVLPCTLAVVPPAQPAKTSREPVDNYLCVIV